MERACLLTTNPGGVLPRIDDIKSRRVKEDIDKFSNFDSQNSRTKKTSDVDFDDYIRDVKADFVARVASSKNKTKLFLKKTPKNPIKHSKINFELNYSYKSLAIAVAVCVFVLFSLIRITAAKSSTEKLSIQARDHLQQSFSLIDSGDIGGAMEEADEAKKDIGKIKLIAQSWGQDIQYLRLASASNSKLLANERLLDASYNIINTLSVIHGQLANISFLESKTSGLGFSFNVTDNQQVLISVINNGKSRLNNGKTELLLARKGLSGDQAAEVDDAISVIDKTIKSIDSSQVILEKDLTWLSGADGKEKNILILFQNNSELRGGSGGSLGSFGVAHFKEGSLTGIDFGINIYKIDQAFRDKTKITAPDELKWLMPDSALTMKDSGWDVDGPKAMERILWFYNQETGNSADGVMMIDTTAFTSLLKEVGTIEVSELGKNINADNFKDEVEYEVHKGYFDREGDKEENEPKKILSLMMPKFLDKLFSALKDTETSPAIFASLSKSLKQKDITLYFTNEEFEKRLADLNYSANVYPSVGDYIYVNNSNLDGLKSSLSMEESLKFSTTISAEGGVVDFVDLIRYHTGSDVWPDGLNKNFIRFLIPQNSEVTNFETVQGYFEQMFDKGLKDGKAFWTSDDYGKKIVNFWMSTKPKEKSEVKINYTPSYSVDTDSDFNYSITFQKQPGAPTDNVEFELNYPDNFEPQNVQNFDKKNKKILIKFNLDQDKTIKIKFKKIL
ncbi:MAG: DUF4012 domain-containing protein [Patescibacteria group bacterium]